MALVGRLHPLLVHFPIALVLIAGVAEVIAIVGGRSEWRYVAIVNIRVGAIFALAAAIAGWMLASSSTVDDVRTLGFHRFLGTAAAVAAVAAALATASGERRSPALICFYRIVLLSAAALVAVTGHLGGILVWGADFLRP